MITTYKFPFLYIKALKIYSSVTTPNKFIKLYLWNNLFLVDILNSSIINLCYYLSWKYKIRLLMHNSFSILPIKMIIIYCLIHTITTEWLSLNYLSTYIPAHTYSIYCTRNSRISGNVTWSGSSDLDVYAYAEGSDLFSSSALIKFWSITPGI